MHRPLGVHVLQGVVLWVALLRVHVARRVRVRVPRQVVRGKTAPTHRVLHLWVLPPQGLLLVVRVGRQRVAR